MYTHVFLFDALFKLRRLKCFIRVSVAVVEAKGLQKNKLSHCEHAWCKREAKLYWQQSGPDQGAGQPGSCPGP